MATPRPPKAGLGNNPPTPPPGYDLGLSPEYKNGILLRAAWLQGQMNLVLDVDGWEYDIDLTPGQESQVARHSQFHRRLRVRHEADWSG